MSFPGSLVLPGLLITPGLLSSTGPPVLGSPSPLTLLIVFVVVALSFSFLCSILEAVLLSITPSYLAGVENERPAIGGSMRKMKENIDRPLAGILSLNTIAHTVGAAGAGAQAAKVFGDAYLGLISGVLTLLILFVSEIIPKTLGAVYWRSLAPSVVRILGPIQIAMWPLVKVSEQLTKLLARGKKEAHFNREEFKALAEIGEREGVFGTSESRILGRLLRFEKVRAQDIMTPRTVMFTFHEELTVDEVLAGDEELRFSRIPIYGHDRDDITGFVLKTDILAEAVRQRGSTKMVELKRALELVPEVMTLHQLLDHLTGRRSHAALVVDEYGGTSGLVTLEDLFETLIGIEIVDEVDAVQDMQELARQAWEKRARSLGIVPEDVSRKDAEG